MSQKRVCGRGEKDNTNRLIAEVVVKLHGSSVVL